MTRLYRTQMYARTGAEAAAGCGTERPTECLLDLESVVFAISDPDDPADTTLHLDIGEEVCLAEPFETFAAAWCEYRQQADAIARLRN